MRDGGTDYSSLIGRYCASAPSTQYSTDNMIFIRFFTDIDVPRNGFKANITLNKCGGTVRGFSGIVSYNNPTAENADINCTWHIVGPADYYLHMNLSALKCYHGSFYIYDDVPADSNCKYNLCK